MSPFSGPEKKINEDKLPPIGQPDRMQEGDVAKRLPTTAHSMRAKPASDKPVETETAKQAPTPVDNSADTSVDITPEEASFAETAMRLGGKSDHEARSIGAVDKADEQVEALFEKRYQTVNSPIHLAVWDDFDARLFMSPAEVDPAEDESLDHETRLAMGGCLATVSKHKAYGSLLNESGKLTDDVLKELGENGYWGTLIEKEFGGKGLDFKTFALFLRKMATIDPTTAGLASVHGCIGAVDPLVAFGNDEQKQRFLPRLASGEALSAFALTEPGAGSDLTALKTTAQLDGDHYVIHGEKLFITNAVPGRTIGLVCLIDKKPSVLIVDLPKEENEQFKVKSYGLYALKQAFNNGLIFNGLRVPKENLLAMDKGDGLTIAYHGLNRGRVALCANAAGVMRSMMASMLPWADYRKTYGAAIDTRELVQRRLGRLAGLMAASDSLTLWCSHLLDQGYRGEMECIIAKIFGSEAQKEAAIELFMKTHGGRSFLHGHMFGDNVHEFLAPCIYEGEGEMLGMALFKSLVKEHGRKHFEPVGKVLAKHNMRQPNPLNPIHAWRLRNAVKPYLKWRMKQLVASGRAAPLHTPDDLHHTMVDHVQFAARNLRALRMEIDAIMNRYQLKLPDRQCVMSEISGQVQRCVIIAVTALNAGRSEHEDVRMAADVMCHELRRELKGKRPSGKDFARMRKLGKHIAENGYSQLKDVASDEILMRYDAK